MTYYPDHSLVGRKDSMSTGPLAPSVVPDTGGLLARLTIGCGVLASFTSTWGGVYLAGIQVADILLVLAIGCISVLVLFSGLRFSLPEWIYAPAAALLLCLLVRSVLPVPDRYFSNRFQLAEYVPGDVGKALFWMIALIGVPLVITASAQIDRRAVTWVLAAFVSGVAVSCTVAVSDLLGLTHISASLGYDSISLRQTGLAIHPNTLGVVCALAAPFAVYFLSRSTRPLIPLAGLVLLFAGAALCGSRGAQAAVPLATAVAFFFVPNAAQAFRRLAVSGVIVASVAAIALWRTQPEAFSQIFRFTDSDSSAAGSDSERTVLASQAIGDILSYPFFGIGIKHITEAHSIYLQVLSCGGLVLALGMAIYWVGALSGAWTLTREKEPLGPFLLIAVAAWLILGAIQNQLTDRLLYYTIGCVVALYTVRRHPGKPSAVHHASNAGRVG